MSDAHDTAIAPAAVETRPMEHQGVHPVVQVGLKMLGETPNPETLRDLMALQREWMAAEAKRSFTRALIRLKRDMPAVLERDQQVSFGTTRYRHTSLAAAMNAVDGPLGRNGFAISWKAKTEGGQVSVTCRLIHEDGHEDKTTIESPPDTSGSKGKAQAIASTITYLERYTLLALLGIATADMREPHGPKPGDEDPSAVDERRNLDVASKITARGLTRYDAEEHVGRPVKEWTTADIDALREWVVEQTKVKKAAERQPGEDFEDFDLSPDE